MLDTFDKAEIVFVGTSRSEIAELAETSLRGRLERAGASDRYRVRTVILPAESRSVTADCGGLLVGQTGGGSTEDQELVQEQVGQADLILAPSESERADVEGRFAGARGKVLLLTEAVRPAGEDGWAGSSEGGIGTSAPPALEKLVEAGFEAILRRAEENRAQAMSRVGLSTSLYLFEEVPPSLATTLELMGRAGVRFADWSHDAVSDPMYTPAEMDQAAELLETNGLQCQQIHGFETDEFNPVAKGEALDRYVDIQSNRIELCARLGGDAVVVHIPGNHCTTWDGRGLAMDEEMEYSTVALDRLRPLCEKLGVTIAVENSGVVRYDRDCERLDFYLSRYPASFITFCLDVGHANRHGSRALEGLKQYGTRLSALHLHDNRGVEDDHQPPFFGTIDWRELLGWVHEIGYARCLNFELLYERQFFDGGHAEFVASSARRIRHALSLVPAVKQVPS